MKNKAGFLWVSLAGLVLLAGCSKDPLRNLTEDESRLYITNKDNTADFTKFKTFSVADSVAVVENNNLLGGALRPNDAEFIDAVKTQMQARGYTLVNRNQNPELGINITRIYNTYTGLVSYPDFYGVYSGYWNPYYWGYPGYSYYFPSFYGVYQVTEGALSIDMLDLKDASSGNNTIKGIWNGLIRGSGIFRDGKASGQVQALFDQSPYIKAVP